jgi:hypothetical protein
VPWPTSSADSVSGQSRQQSNIRGIDVVPLWTESKFLIADLGGSSTVWGFTYRGLGMWKCFEGSKKGKRPPTWSLTHLGSGHRIGLINLHMAQAFDIATSAAETMDWDWGGLEGYRNRSPDIARELAAFASSAPKGFKLTVGGGSNSETARQIAEALL